MSIVFRKLNLTTQRLLHVLNAPATFGQELSALTDTRIVRTLSARQSTGFVIVFGVTQAQLDRMSEIIVGAAEPDAIVWIAYPKQSSRKYRCEFNRDSGWSVLAAAGFEPVRQVAIDADWTALRFRRVEFIKQITRRASTALSAEGKRRASKS